MKKVKRHTVHCLLFIIFLLEISPCQIVDAGGAVAKNSSSEWYIENGHSGPSVRWKRKYGLLAKNVKSVKAAKCISTESGAVFISQREGEWRNIDFSKKYFCEIPAFKNTGGCWADDGMLACIRNGALL